MDTDEIRQKVRNKQRPIDEELANWLYDALGEIDRLEKEQGEVRSELKKWHVETIEQRLKEKVRENLKKLIPKNMHPVYEEAINQAVDAAGVKNESIW